jgi:phosphoenolpyruvate carboxykinase (GTP)
MGLETREILSKRLNEKELQKLERINNPSLNDFIAKYLELCNPSSVFVCTDSEEDIQYIRESAIHNCEEAKLKISSHTVHFDGYFDQARDKAQTKFLLPKGVDLGPEINSIERESGLTEIHEILKNIMAGHEVFVKFFCLGPKNSEFSIPCVQLTDSSYVAHSEDLLYRQGYSEFVRYGDPNNTTSKKKICNFFKFVHSQGELEEAGLGLNVSKNIGERRVYIDLESETIFSTNTQYGGNTIGLKKLAMRLAINRASKDGWLTEHMLIVGVHGPKDRVSYFTGAFPSMCGKTTTAMLDGETIVGDDIAYLKNINDQIYGVNVEKGMFGIIEGINAIDDPLQWKALHSKYEIIFSNVLVTEDKTPYWNNKEKFVPQTGVNHSGDWFLNKKDGNDKLITPSHKNARFTLSLEILENVDENLHNPDGVEISGLIYGGRDSDTWVPVEESFNWEHGVITKGAVLESETTAATLGQEGVRVFNPMSNLDFLSIPIGKYVQNNLDFGKNLKNTPKIFSVNYFLKDDNGKFMNHKNDKKVWLKWMELRVHRDVDAILTPTGYIPLFEDLKRLFKEYLNKDYSKIEYNKQFKLRIPENIVKIDRMVEVYKNRVLDAPQIIFDVLNDQRDRLILARGKFGNYVKPSKFKKGP